MHDNRTSESAADVRPPVLDVIDITKRFGGVTAIDDVSLAVHQGEIVALVGDNGAGKSTLVKTVAGVHQADSGEIRIGNEPVQFTGPSDSRATGIEVVYQDLALAPNLDVTTNMFLGRELTRWPIKVLRKRMMRVEARQILTDLSIHVPSIRTVVRSLSGGQRQGVAIGRAAHWATQLVVMDEPTAALGVQETASVEAMIRRLRDRELAVLLVSHNLDQVFRLADRIYVLRRGKLAGHRTVSEVDSNEIVSLITGLS